MKSVIWLIMSFCHCCSVYLLANWLSICQLEWRQHRRYCSLPVGSVILCEVIAVSSGTLDAELWDFMPVVVVVVVVVMMILVVSGRHERCGLDKRGREGSKQKLA
jgi:hypothetical protein